MLTGVAGLFVSAVTMGLIYALVASGFSLIFGIARVFFLAHSEIYMLGAVGGVYLIQEVGIPYFLALLIVMFFSGAFGLLVERFLRPLHGEELPTLITSIALGILISHSALFIFGRESKGVIFPFQGAINLFGASLTIEKLAVSCISVAILVGLHFFCQRTKVGQSIRAVSQDKEAAMLQGIDPNYSQALTFAIAFVAAGAAGILVAPIFFVDVFLGEASLGTMLFVVILGGLGSFPGAIAGGLTLGFINSFGSYFIGHFAELLGFVAVIVILSVMPRGLMGRE